MARVAAGVGSPEVVRRVGVGEAVADDVGGVRSEGAAVGCLEGGAMLAARAKELARQAMVVKEGRGEGTSR